MNTYKRFRYPHQIISHANWLYHRFTPTFAKPLKKKQGALGDEWYLDEVFIKIGQAHRFLSNQGVINNHFRQQHHLFKDKYYLEI